MDINSLERFLQAQTLMYPVALEEIKSAKKQSHWMWYMFPQLRGLGTSFMAHTYGISGLDEATRYLEHPVLSGRLQELCGELLKHKGKNVVEIFGDIDAMKLKSSMTLFSLTSEDYTIFDEVLEAFFDGEMDEVSVELINCTEHLENSMKDIKNNKLLDEDEIYNEIIRNLEHLE